MAVLQNQKSLEERGLTAVNYLVELNQCKKPVLELLRRLNNGIAPVKYRCLIPERVRNHEFLAEAYRWFEIDPWNGVMKFFIAQNDLPSAKEVMNHSHWEFAEICLLDEIQNSSH
ncbi:MAG TPA: hypothetical protein PKD34_02335 [Candidatus Doudnabacteria bacterium]|nr:hypothetical protein [Candidatus Doudnabacteria bacterium]